MQNNNIQKDNINANLTFIDVLNAINDIEKNLTDKITDKILESENRITNQIIGRIMKEIDELTEITSNSFTRIEKRLSKLETSVASMEETLNGEDCGLKIRLNKTESTSKKHSTYFEGFKKTLQPAWILVD